MKKKRSIKYPLRKSSALELKETALAQPAEAEPMVRTQIYLNRREYEFIQREARRRDEPMAAVIRGFIDEKMEIPEDAWTNNPIFRPLPRDPDSEGHEDSGINHDHYIYGCPKKWIKVNGEYIEAPPLPDDYYKNPRSAEAYDRKLSELGESK
jgi:hypothetical protein